MKINGPGNLLAVTILVCQFSTAHLTTEAQVEPNEIHNDHPQVVFVVGEREYQTNKTLPWFAQEFLAEDYVATFVFESESDPNDFPGLRTIQEADVVILSVRRRLLKPESLQLLRDYAASDKPIIGIRTASHAFSLRNQAQPEGREQWPEFDAQVFGGNYTNHYGNDLKPSISPNEENREHELLKGLSHQTFTSQGSLYKTSPINESATVLLTGEVPNEDAEPVAWYFERQGGGRSYYTSLGHPKDFENPDFCQLLLNFIQHATNETSSDHLPGTKPLTIDGDLASIMVDGIDRFLLNELQQSIDRRKQHWNRDLASPEAYHNSILPNRQRLKHILGIKDERASNPEPQFLSSMSRASHVGKAESYDAYRMVWNAFEDVTGEGLLLIGNEPEATVIAIPDCQSTPEQLAGIAPGVPENSQFARQLAARGCRVMIPSLINRQEKIHQITNREWQYRSAFEMGRTVIGYEIQKVLAMVDWHHRNYPQQKIGIYGYGEGALIAMYAAACDPRIDSVVVSGYFSPREEMWREPIDRNVFGLLEQFGDAEIAAMIAPRHLIVEACESPDQSFAGGRGAPGEIRTPSIESVRREVDRAKAILADAKFDPNITLIESDAGKGPFGSEPAIHSFLESLGVESKPSSADLLKSTPYATLEYIVSRHEKQMHELERHTQRLLADSHFVRQDKTMGRFDFSSLQAYKNSAESIRKDFYENVIGRFENDVLPPNPRTRKFQESESWIAYEVVLDVFPDVIAYGLLLVPKDIDEGEKRPVVVCQHGLEGRPQHTIGQEGYRSYKAFASQLADRGFVVFAPQNPYIFEDRFRSLQRKANPLGKSLFSIITPQHQQIVDWLQSLDFVADDRIGFYGLSYGGKTAMRVPALVTDYCLSICSADFNEWVDKNASVRNPRSYLHTGEYEIFEFDLGHTFNYAEMAALIAPRPFMVERGHSDGVADDWTVGWEYAKVRNLYAAKLKIPDRTEIEWFDGPHTINGKGTFEFLHKHLNWPN